MGETYGIQNKLRKPDLDHDDIYEDTPEKKRDEWLPYLKMDDLSFVFVYARYSMLGGTNFWFWNERMFEFTFSWMEIFQFKTKS